MINRRLSTAEAAARLGVKPETLYAYVSRGLLHPERTGRGSTFDPQEVAQLARTGRHPPRAGVASSRRAARAATDRGPADPVFLTELTLIERSCLYYRGLDAVMLSRSRTFEEVATWLWTGEWADELHGQGPDSGGGEWALPANAEEPLRRSMADLSPDALPVERFMVAVATASLADDLRHDLTPSGVAVTGRGLLAVMAAALPLAGALPLARALPLAGAPPRAGGGDGAAGGHGG